MAEKDDPGVVHEVIVVGAEHERLVFPQETLRDIAVILDFVGKVGLVDERHLELAGQPLCNVYVGYESEFYEDRTNAFPVVLLTLQP